MAGRKRRWVVVSAAVAAALGTVKAKAGNFYWEGDNGNAWNALSAQLGTNWSSQLNINVDTSASLPGAGDDVFFYGLGAPSGPINSTLGQNFSIHSLTFLSNNIDSVVIDGSGVNSLTIGAGGISIFGSQSGNNQITANVVVGADQTWVNNIASNTLTVGGVISGTSTLTTAGPGLMNFTNANSLSGGLVLGTAGNTVTFGGASASATNLSSLTIKGGAFLNLDSSSVNHVSQNRLADNLAINSTGGTFSMYGSFAAPTTETVGTLQIGSGLTQINVISGVATTLTFGSPALTSLTRTTGGTVNFNPAQGNAIKMPNVATPNGIIGGWATIGDTTRSDPGNFLDFATVSGGTVVPLATYQTGPYASWAATDNVKVSDSQNVSDVSKTINSLYLTGNAMVTFGTSGAATGSGNLLVIGSGGIISNAATGFTGINNQPTLNNIALIGGAAAADNANAPALSGKITSSGSDLVITTASNLQINSIITDNGAPVGLTKNGSGLLDLSAGNNQAQPGTAEIQNTYTGITTINAGTILVNDDRNFGAIPAAVTPNSITLNGGTILTTRGFGFNPNRGITVGPQGGTLAYEGGATWTIAQKITGPGGVTFASVPGGFAANNNNQINLNSPAGSNNYQGPTVLNTNKATGGATALILWVADEQIPDNSAVTLIGNGGTTAGVNMANHTETIGSLASDTGVGRIFNLGAFTTGGNNLSTSYGGTLEGTGSLTKVGNGVQTLTGNNIYTGPTKINGGTLLINGSPTATGLISVNAGGSLGGNGTIAAPVTVNAGGALAPAVTLISPSVLNINNNVTLASGATLNYLFGAPGSSDMVNVNNFGNTLTLAAGSDVLNINDMAGFGPGTYTLLQAQGGAVLSDLANFVIHGSTAFNYAVSATNGASGSVVLTVTPGNPILVWGGTTNNIWNTSTPNWVGPSTVWADGDNAIFDSTGSARATISVVAGGVLPNSMEFDNGTFNYSFSGGPITSAGNFTKNQGGGVTFNNIVSVGVGKINAGSVTVGAGGSLTSPSLTVGSAAALNVNGSLGSTTSLQSDGVTTFTGPSQTLASLNGAATGIVNLNGPTALSVANGTFNGIISGVGASVTVNSADGSGALVLAGPSTYTGATSVISGTLVAGGNVAGGVAGPFGIASTPILVGATTGAGSAKLLAGGPFTITRDIVVQNGNTGGNTLGGSTGDTSTFANNISLSNTNVATMLAAGTSGTVNYSGTLSGAGGVNVVGPGTTVFNGTTATYTGPTLVSGGSLNLPGVLNTNSLSVGSADNGGTFNLVGTGSLTSTNAVTVNPGGTFNYASPAAIASVPTFNVSAPGTVNAQLTFASGVSYTNAVNVLGAGFVTISATDTANANLIAGPINLSNAGGMILMVQQQPAGAAIPLNIYNGRINVIGTSGTNGADGILQVRNSGVSTVVGEGIFTNVHLANNSSLDIGLVPSAATPRDQIIVDLKMDGTSAALSSNSDGSSPEFVRDVSASSPGSVLTIFPINGSNIANLNGANAAIPGTFTPVGAKSINFVGNLSPNVTIFNTEAAPGGINLTSNTNITSSGLGSTSIASFSLNGGTFWTGTDGVNAGTTNLVATADSPGTSGTFLVTLGGTFNVNRSADATITYQAGTLLINSDQTLTGFNIGDGVNPISYALPSFNITTGSLKILNGAAVSTSFNTLQAGPTQVDGTLVVTGAGIVNTGILTGAGEIDLFSEPGLVTGDAGSGTFSGVIAGFATLTKQGSGVWTVSGTNNTYAGPTIVNAGTLKVTGSIVTSSGVTVNDGFFEAGASQTVNALTLLNTGNAKITSSAHPATPIVLKVNTLSLGSLTSAVDVTNNAMIIENSDAASVRAMIISGRNNGTWTGPGINSSSAAASSSNRAVGYADAATLLAIGAGNNAPWLGQTADSTSILVRYTILGDSNLDGAVNFTDLVAVAQHYGVTTGATWQTGDSNYDGAVNFTDLVAVAQNYGGALPSSAIPGAPVNFAADLSAAFSNVPEPGGLMVVAAAAGLLSRRVRRRKAV